MMSPAAHAPKTTMSWANRVVKDVEGAVGGGGIDDADDAAADGAVATGGGGVLENARLCVCIGWKALLWWFGHEKQKLPEVLT